MGFWNVLACGDDGEKGWILQLGSFFGTGFLVAAAKNQYFLEILTPTETKTRREKAWAMAATMSLARMLAALSVTLAKAMPDPSLAKTIIRVEMNSVKASFKASGWVDSWCCSGFFFTPTKIILRVKILRVRNIGIKNVTLAWCEMILFCFLYFYVCNSYIQAFRLLWFFVKKVLCKLDSLFLICKRIYDLILIH